MDSILTGNCRGASHNSFLSVLKHFVQVYNPTIVAVLEPRISGLQGSQVRANMGYQFFSIVEAHRFSGGIWLLWNDPHLNIRHVCSLTSSFMWRLIPRTRGNSSSLLCMARQTPVEDGISGKTLSSFHKESSICG
ncbi:hypothetical protein LINPERPRIM_LOCUS37876 [Linum perenne]